MAAARKNRLAIVMYVTGTLYTCEYTFLIATSHFLINIQLLMENIYYKHNPAKNNQFSI